MMNATMTLADLLADLRFVADCTGPLLRRASEIDLNGAHLVDLGWAERVERRFLRVTDEGLDVLFFCRDVVLPEADAA